MSGPPLALFCLERPPEQASGKPPLLILLHGVGSNEQDLFELAPYLDPRFLVLSARAPIQLSPGSYAWFHVQFIGGAPRVNADEAERSRLRLAEFIRQAVESRQADPGRVLLMGFSQGAIMSQSVMLTRPDLLAGVVAMSGRILPEVRPLAVPPAQLAGFPVLVQHGLYDQVLPIEYGRDTRGYLSTLPVDLSYREYPMGHQITDESLADAAAWLTGRLDRE